MSTTALMIAKEQCSNCSKDGNCLGMDFDSNGEHKRFRPEGKCWLAIKGRRCEFFETAVMPMDRSALTPKAREDWETAIADYRRSANVFSKSERICPECKERELEPRKRFCYVCRNKRLKAVKRASRKGSEVA